MEQEIKSAEKANYISQIIREYNSEIKVIVKLPFNEYIIKHDELLVNLYDKFILSTHSKDVKPIEPISDGWISVEDDLPEFDKKVLVFGESKGMNPQMGGAYIALAKRQDLTKTSMAKDAERYQDENQFSQMRYVTHWKPLPPKPQITSK